MHIERYLALVTYLKHKQKTSNMNDKEEIGTMKEQKVAIDNLEEILHFLKSVQIKDDDIIVNIKKPLDNLKSINWENPRE